MGFTAVCCIADLIYACREFAGLQFHDSINYISEILYSLGSLCAAYFWFLYAELKQESRILGIKKISLIIAVPFVIMCLFTVTTPLHKLSFYFEDSHYVRGPLNVPFTVITSLFIVVSGVTALIRSFFKRYHSKVAFLRLLFTYMLVLVGSQVFQIVVGSIIPFRTLFATIVFMVITLRGMTEMVTVDALSSINNRFALDKALDAKLTTNEEFYVLMLDIDNFKHINDEFGHVEGDKAIQFAALAIVRSVPHSYFVSRFGGDEFAILAPSSDESIFNDLENRINEEICKVIKENKASFSFTISLGYAKRDDGVDNAPDIIEKADQMLYEVKNAKKVERL